MSETLDRLHGLGGEGVVEDLIGDSLTLASLPFGYDPANDRFVRRERRWPSDNFSDALPVFGDWRGTVRPGFHYFSMRGAPIAFDLFDNEAPHAVISGADRSWKVRPGKRHDRSGVEAPSDDLNHPQRAAAMNGSASFCAGNISRSIWTTP